MILRRALRCTSGASAAELALVMPLLILIGTGSFEVGNFFLNEHRLEKSVRDAARYAARQAFSNYAGCGATSSNISGNQLETDVRALVRKGQLSGGIDILPGMADDQITLSMTCSTTAGTETLKGVYLNLASQGVAGAPVVSVTAAVPYTSVLKTPIGFSGVGKTLNATQQAAVVGL